MFRGRIIRGQKIWNRVSCILAKVHQTKGTPLQQKQLSKMVSMSLGRLSPGDYTI